MITLDIIRKALHLPNFDAQQAQETMAPHPRSMLPENRDKPIKEAGVLGLVYPDVVGYSIILTRRTDHLGTHSGQISFPGGKKDPQDTDFIATALRETCEELGVCDDEITILGKLNHFYIPPSHFTVYPTIGSVAYKPTCFPNPHEVAEVIYFPLAELLNPHIKGVDEAEMRGVKIRLPYYLFGEHKIWGATAAMLGELEQRLRAAMKD
jgi:8-oxo-dGTP pyrophosphatase MutT (NUDIX family)